MLSHKIYVSLSYVQQTYLKNVYVSDIAKLTVRVVKTDYPARSGPALTGFGLYQVEPKSPVEK
jgi:hypothetical protein